MLLLSALAALAAQDDTIFCRRGATHRLRSIRARYLHVHSFLIAAPSRIDGASHYLGDAWTGRRRVHR